MGKKVKIGVFGGGRGKMLIESIMMNEMETAELVAVCDRYEPLLDEVKKKAGEYGIEVACYREFDDFIRHDMDAVVLANFATEHAPYAIRCMKAGKHVLSEVMPCETIAQGIELIEAVEETGMIYCYAENYCFQSHVMEMWRRYRNGDIGEIIYGEGEYDHDISLAWPQLCYGDPNHWRSLSYATFYSSHSLGPLLYITGLRPVKVVGYETPGNPEHVEVGFYRGVGLEMVTLENGAVIKSMHGWLKREPSMNFYELYGQKGVMETGRLEGSRELNVYIEGKERCRGGWEYYDPRYFIDGEKAECAKAKMGHGGSDFYPVHLFIQKILGNPEGDLSVDVYQAMDMGLCGILAHRSILAGNKPMEIPDFRNPKERDAWRNDRACTNPEIAGDQLIPVSVWQRPENLDDIYAKIREDWIENRDSDGNPRKHD